MIQVTSKTGTPLYQFDLTNYQRNWKRNSSRTEVVGVCNATKATQKQGILQHCIQASANFDPNKCTVKRYYYGGKRQNRTQAQATDLAILWRQAAKEKIMEINNDIYNAWKGNPTTPGFPTTMTVSENGMAQVPVEDWECYKKLITNQLNRIK
jgi:hypothetical protein